MNFFKMGKIGFSAILLFACMNLGFALEKVEPKTFMVALSNMCDTQHKLQCGGVLIRKDYILTAAHCVYGAKCLRAQMHKGKYDPKEEQKEIEKIIIHPFYVHGTHDYDVAVLKIQPFKSFKVNFKLKDGEPQPNAFKIGGWDGEFNFKFFDGLVMDRNMCQKMTNHTVITSRNICIMSSFFSTVGGYPAFIESKSEYYLVGIATSRSKNQLTPYLFTNIHNSEIHSFVAPYYELNK